MDIKQHKAVLYLATGANNQQAADAVGVSISALEKWKRNQEFQQLLKVAIQQIYTASIAELAKGALQAAEELRRITTDPEASDRVKISAISVLFSQLEKTRSWDLEQRLSRIEEILENGSKPSETEAD